MNWYKNKKYSETIPIKILSYFDNGELNISFNGGKRYIYYDVQKFQYSKLKKLLDNKNYSSAKKLLDTLKKNYIINNPETKEEKNKIMDELQNRGLI